jgi:hypothetical protein
MFADDVVDTLSPLIRALSGIISDPYINDQPVGDPDGFDGLSRSGGIERLLVSEWLLADEIPDEFIRRLSMSELQFLKPAFRSPASTGRIVALVDVGPSQLGAPRLVHLAALLILARRARTQGTDLMIGILGNPVDEWYVDVTKSVIKAWLKSRRTVSPTYDNVTQRLSLLGEADHVWVLSNVVRPTSAPETIVMHQLRTQEDNWSDDGVNVLAVTVDKTTLRLPMPHAHMAIRILRGEGFHQTARQPSTPKEKGLLRFPIFAGHPWRLLCRGNTPEEVIGVSISRSAEPDRLDRSRLRTYVFPGRVLAACCDPKRVVGLYEDNGMLRVKTFGSNLASVDRMAISRNLFDLFDDDIDSLAEQPFALLYFHSGSLAFRFSDMFYKVAPNSSDFRHWRIQALAHTRIVDRPAVVSKSYAELFGGETSSLTTPSTHIHAMLGNGCVGSSENGLVWLLQSASTKDAKIERHGEVHLDEGEVALGMIRDGQEPALVTISAGQHLLRLRGAKSTRTITELCGEIANVSVHPIDPVIAVQHNDFSIQVFDLASQKIVATIQSGVRP